MQLGINMSHPLIPKFTIGYATREIVLLEFSSTIMCMILAGKCGSSIASEIGTMRITEQLDAMDIMGVNSANYVILPKIVGMMLFVPVLVMISMLVGLGVVTWLVYFRPIFPSVSSSLGFSFSLSPIISFTRW